MLIIEFMAALRKKPVLKKVAQRKKQIMMRKFAQAGFLSSFLILVIGIGSIVGILIYSGSANPGDLLYPIKRDKEDTIVNFTTVNPEDRIPVLINQTKERLAEAGNISSDTSKDLYFRKTLKDYKDTLGELDYQLYEARSRSRDISAIEPDYIKSILDNLSSLDKMYDNTHLEQQDALTDAVDFTANYYHQEYDTLKTRRTDLDYVGFNAKYYEIQQDLRNKGVLID